MVRCALYTRVSTEMQANREEGSLDTQEARLRAAVFSRGPDYEVARVFREEGASGKNLDRPAMQQLLAAIKAGEVDLIMATRLDRLSRSLLDFFHLHKLFEEHGVRFFSLNESFDTSTPAGRAMLKILLVFAEFEREQTSERTRQAFEARARRGLWNGGHPPLGYDSDGHGHLSVNETEAAVVRAAFDQMLELRSTREVARWLNAQGYRQKRYSSRRGGDTGVRLFNRPVVTNMLKNPLYLGRVPYKGQYFDGQHAGIIEPVTFDRVQQALELNRQGLIPIVPGAYAYLLTGVTRCGCCDLALTSVSANGRNRKKYFYYQCVSMNKKARTGCTVKRLSAPKLEDAVLSLARQAAADPELVAGAASEAERVAREQVAPVLERLDDPGRNSKPILTG